MAISLEIGVSDLLPELLANALVLLGALETAGAIAAGTLQAVLYCLDHFCIFIESNSHGNSPFSFYYNFSVKYSGFSGRLVPTFYLGVCFLFSFWHINAIITKICPGGYI